MALNKQTVQMWPSSTGKGGFVTVSDDDATAAVINADPYWAKPAQASPPTRENTDAREMVDALHDFVEKQSPAPTKATGGVMLHIAMASAAVGNVARRRLYIDAGGGTRVLKTAAA